MPSEITINTNELFNFVDREAITFKLDKVIETYSSITKTSHKCDYVYISPPYDFYTKSGYKKPAPRLKKNKIEQVKSFLESNPTIQQLEELHYFIAPSTGGYFTDKSARITDLIS